MFPAEIWLHIGTFIRSSIARLKEDMRSQHCRHAAYSYEYMKYQFSMSNRFDGKNPFEEVELCIAELRKCDQRMREIKGELKATIRGRLALESCLGYSIN